MLEGGKTQEDGDLSQGWRLSLLLPVVQILYPSFIFQAEYSECDVSHYFNEVPCIPPNSVQVCEESMC